ncbi:MAG: CoA transferase [Cytophagales bacterium]|nr:CoA transferase [Cytophagales bacterium]
MFDGLKILELASVLAGPSVGQFFAELGAEVIKVENPRTAGDVTRSWKTNGEQTDDRSAYFCSCNWGKKSIALDLNKDADRAIVLQLAKRADIVLASYKPGDAEKLGVAFEQLRQENPAVIYGQISGYGPDDDRVGYDAVVQAESGFMDLNGEPDGPPTKMPVALIDVLAAHQLKEGLLIALLKKERTGEGSLVEVSLLQTAIASLANQATNWLVAGKLPRRQGSAHPNIAPYGDSFLSRDGKRLLLAVGSDRQFEQLSKVLGLGDEPGFLEAFRTNSVRVEKREELKGILAAKIRTRESGELLVAMHKKKIPAGLIQNVQEVFASSQARDLHVHADGISGVRSFVATGTPKVSAITPPPHLDAHRREIIALISA